MTLWLSTRRLVTGRSAEKVAPRSIGRKRAAARLALDRLEIEPGAAEQVDRDGALDPALEQHRLARARRRGTTL